MNWILARYILMSTDWRKKLHRLFALLISDMEIEDLQSQGFETSCFAFHPDGRWKTLRRWLVWKCFNFLLFFSLSFRWDLHTRKRILLYIRRLLWMTAPAVTLTSLSSTEASTMESAMAAGEWSISTMVYPSRILVMRWTTRCSSALLLLLRHFSPVCWMLPRRLTEVWRMWGLLKTGWEFPLLLFTWNVYFQHICSNAISSSWKGTISYVIKLTK